MRHRFMHPAESSLAELKIEYSQPWTNVTFFDSLQGLEKNLSQAPAAGRGGMFFFVSELMGLHSLRMRRFFEWPYFRAIRRMVGVFEAFLYKAIKDQLEKWSWTFYECDGFGWFGPSSPSANHYACIHGAVRREFINWADLHCGLHHNSHYYHGSSRDASGLSHTWEEASRHDHGVEAQECKAPLAFLLLTA